MDGNIVELIGTVKTYRDELQVCVEQMEIVETADLDDNILEALVPTAPINRPEYCWYIRDTVEEIAHPELNAICNDLLNATEICFQRYQPERAYTTLFVQDC